MIPLEHITKLRVRYPETDAMGYVHHSVYPQYYEYARVELLRDYGVLYTQMEADGIMLPVRELHIEYLKPARFDDELTIKTSIEELPGITFTFLFEIWNQHYECINKARVVLVFADVKTGKPLRNAFEYVAHLFNSSLKATIE